jgi:nicotinamidase-related amidase
MRAVVAAAREAKMKIFFVPHHRWASGDLDGWRFPTPSQQGAGRYQVFGKDTWGGSFHEDFPVCEGDIVAAEHWAQSGFSGTDLDQQLRQHGTDHVIVIGMMANTCVQSTARYAMELGYHVMLATDATSAASAGAMHVAHAVNDPTYAHAITDPGSLLAALGSATVRLAAAAGRAGRPSSRCAPPRERAGAPDQPRSSSSAAAARS